MTYGRPGVYLSERLLPAPIATAGAANAAGAAIGAFAQGPESVTLVTSWYDFVKQFGGYNVLYPSTFGVGMFFQNGGGELYVRRILHSDAVAAGVSIPKATGSGNVGTVTAKNRGADGNNLRVQLTAVAGRSGYYNLVVYKETVAGTSSDVTNDIILEQYNNVILNDVTSSDYISTVVNFGSSNISIYITDVVDAPAVSVLPLTGGLDGTKPVGTDYTDAVSDFAIVNRPLVLFAPEVISAIGSSDGKDVHNALISWAESNNSFAVVDTDYNLEVASALAYSTSLTKSSYGAAYYPPVFISDPVGRSSSSLRKVGPAGAIAGLYIQTDRQTGPFKAPAGVYATIRGAVALERAFTSADLDALNTGAAPLNAIRNLPGAGVVSMGARTLLQDGTANKYVNMRRSLIYIEKQLNDLSQFALFENNDEKLWTRVRTTLGGFLNDYRNQGGLRGDTPDLAYYVKVDAENNTADTIANGEVHIEIGVALQYPAEFIVINLSQKTAA
ncbi:COG3497 Phage tail sheath protein FI [uncultured Caudovirales phage]|uniref:COG3497 Phage tail sheath protein FI n=1 Tax=uncultured Caudovirales phage TaxID=2100421 RepID=A0A6J5KN85_9CAUD|nr:COG3497 Phage tail sheath protein FI [uncultured Caudovirales phage]